MGVSWRLFCSSVDLRLLFNFLSLCFVCNERYLVNLIEKKIWGLMKKNFKTLWEERYRYFYYFNYKGKSEVPPIIVKFVRRNIRNQLYEARRKLKSLTTKDLGLGILRDKQIFIQESLTPRRKELFKRNLEARKDKNFKFIWTSNGNIYLKKDESSLAIPVSSQKDLDKLRQGTKNGNG